MKTETVKLICFQEVISQTTKAHPVNSSHISLVSIEYFHVLSGNAGWARHRAGFSARSISGTEGCQVWVRHRALRRVLAVLPWTNQQRATAIHQIPQGETQESLERSLMSVAQQHASVFGSAV